jgi:hypothetical protein
MKHQLSDRQSCFSDGTVIALTYQCNVCGHWVTLGTMDEECPGEAKPTRTAQLENHIEAYRMLVGSIATVCHFDSTDRHLNTLILGIIEEFHRNEPKRFPGE